MPQPPGPARRARRAQRRSAHRLRRFAGLTAVAAVGVVTLLVTAFGPDGAAESAARSAPAPANRLLPSGPPEPLVVATQGALRVQLPIEQNRVTAIGYHGGASGSLALHPLGRRGNQGLIGRFFDRVFGSGDSSMTWYQLQGGTGSSTSALAVGAAPDTDVYSPVDGTIAGITDYILNGRTQGKRIDIRPLAAPALIVSITRLTADPALTVGSSVAAGRNRLGEVLDLSRLERQALARYTQDAGNHVTVQVFPATALALP